MIFVSRPDIFFAKFVPENLCLLTMPKFGIKTDYLITVKISGHLKLPILRRTEQEEQLEEQQEEEARVSTTDSVSCTDLSMYCMTMTMTMTV